MRFVFMFSACRYMMVASNPFRGPACRITVEAPRDVDFSTGPRKTVDKDRKFSSAFLFLLINLIGFEVIATKR